MQLTSYIKNAADATACTLSVCRKAFDEWSPVPLGTIAFVVALLWSMDILVKKWVRMVRASEGSIFTAKPEPGKKLPLNWDYICTLDNNTKKNFHRLIAVTDDRLKFASYYKMKDYPVLLLLLFSKVSTSIFFFFSCFFGLKSTYFKIFRFGHFQTTEKDHSNGKCCFCNESQSREVEPDQPVIQWTLVVSVVVKLALYYYFYDFLSKVH